MLPRHINLKGVALGLLVLCVSSEFVTAGSLRPNIKLPLQLQESTVVDVIDCLSCDNIKSCGLRLHVPAKCESKNGAPASCMTVYNENGVVQQRGCSETLQTRYENYCIENPTKCLKCDSSNCNDQSTNLLRKDSTNNDAEKIIDEAYNCHMCQGDCENSQETTCDSTETGTRCYVRFNEDNDIIGMGCVSEFQNEQEIIDLVKQKILYICEGELCNGFEHIPMPNQCTSCTSSENENCATTPLAVADSTDCSLIPYTQCYERVNSATGGITERGCVSSLDGDSFWECLTAPAGGNCHLCTGTECNKKIVPADRPKCHRCDSSKDSNCHANPASLSVCPTYNKDESCVAFYENGVTRRDCASQLKCDASNSCQICKGEGCNTANLKRADDIYGIFQELPLNCFTCEGEDCDAAANNPRKCEGDIYQDCLTVFDGDHKVVRRGCELEVLEDYSDHCNEHPQLCFNCKSNGCNTVDDASHFQSCLYCDASKNPDCLFKPESVESTRKCVEGCVASLYTRKSNPAVSDFIRTCFEDIEPDDRPACTAENNCVHCEDKANCNTNVLPAEGRLSCLHCEGSNCNLPESKLCSGFMAEDQCFMYFDNVTFSVLRMGCVSELPVNQVANDIKQYFVCDGDNCNDYGNLPEANVCYVCDSATNVNCAVDPSKISSRARCQSYPYTECYKLITSDGHTKRGCFYDLPVEDFVKCKDGDPSVNCHLCLETNCNEDFYPAERQQCHRCDSVSDPKCEATPATTQACPLYVEDDACVTKLINGATHRGCQSEMSCDGLSRKNCQACEGQNCNVVNLSAQSVGDPGIFQGLPLNCYHCDDEASCGASLGTIRKCEGNQYQTCAVAFNAAGKVAARGCSDDLETTCEDGDHNCYECKSNGCNVASQESDFVDCVFCDAQQGDNCIFDVDAVARRRKCHKQCMTALYPRTDDTQPVYELIRTCLDDMDLDDREACEAGEHGNCQACDTADCNVVDMGERKSCYHCSGDNCQAPEQKTCRAVMEHDQCFIEYDETGSPVEMGCKSKYDPKDVQILVYAKRLWLCDEDNCNDIENVPAAQRCTICNSRTDPECAVNPTNLEIDTNCNRQPFTECYMRILADGHTERGCLSSLENEEFHNCVMGVNSTECVICTGSNCNRKLYPEDRLTCHVCNSETASICDSSPVTPEVCRIYDPNQKCVALVNEKGTTIRGCGDQLTCDASDKANCQICDGNNCNLSNLKRKADGKPGMWQDLPLTCHACDSVADCSSSNAKETTCTDNEYCMTVFDETGAVQMRGCSDAVEAELGDYCNANSPNCHNCNSNKCNSATKASDYINCHYCDSETNYNCIMQPQAIDFRRRCNGACMTALYLKPNSTVYGLVRSCLDDKDEADRNSCEAGSDENCIACADGAACNGDLLPEDRWSCYTCDDGDCESASPKVCKYYRKDDQCFMLFNDQSDLVNMGCASDLDDSFLADNINLLHLCNEGHDCNGFENIPKPKRCIQCDSFDDEDCASNPENIPIYPTCSALPNTQCYTQITENGATRRGCASSLSKPAMLGCITGNSTDCLTCNEDGCNNEVYPADRRRCHRCNSKEDPTCDSAPAASAVCPFYSTSEFCSSKLVNGHTYRGCSSDFRCDATDRGYCRMCEGRDDCNTVDLISTNIGYPGKWQGLPLNCYTCEGEECESGNGVIRKCEGNPEQNCGTVFGADGKVKQRGCAEQIYTHEENESYCDENPDKCKFCKSSGCNTAADLKDFVDCVYCDATENAACIADVDSVKRRRTCHKSCMTGMYPRVMEENPAYILARGCLDDLDLDDREACEKGDMKYCKACVGAACNTIEMPDEPRLQCNACSGTTDCENPKSTQCLAYREGDQCYALFDTGVTNDLVQMGCASDLDNTFLVKNYRKLLLCSGDNCNEESIFPKPMSCAICNSDLMTLCSTRPDGIPIFVGCDHMPYTQCYTRVNEAGVTIRGCLSDVADAVFDDCVSGNSTKCDVCDTTDCNKNIFPPNRPSCYRCNSTQNADCESRPQQYASVCPLYNDVETCVTKLEGQTTRRGCASEFTCDANDARNCRICEGDNCNSIDLLRANVGDPGKWQDLPLNCLVCEGEECATGATVHKCEGNNLQTCMTVFGEDSTVQRRGCSDDVEATHGTYCDGNADKCFSCKSNGCNDAKSLAEYNDCFFCDSNEDENCSVYFSDKTRTRKCKGECMVALYPRTSAANPSYELSRSCLDDMDMDDREKCEAGDLESCQSCSGDRCNTVSIPEERHECFMCQDANCEDIAPQQCSAYHPNDQCYIFYNYANSIVKMGCRSEYEMDAVDDLIREKVLILCDGKNCNTPDMVQTKTCLICDSAEDPRCATNPNLVDNSVRCSTLPYTDCFTRINSDNHTIRGCLGDLPQQQFYGCFMNSDGLCETCTTNNCNSIDVYPENRMRCHQCDSNSNPLCTSSPDSVRACPIYDPQDTCVTNLRNGVTHRGCASSLKCYDESDKRNCRKCNSAGCNSIDLAKVSDDGEPGKWQDVPLTCHHCDSESDCEVGSMYNVCDTNPYQNCMTVFNVAGKVVERGCSDAVEAANEEHCALNPESCLRCNSNGCNNAASLDDYVECVHCDTDSNGECVSNLAGVTKTRKCHKQCMTVMYPREHEDQPAYNLERSCLDDLDIDDREACERGELAYCQVCSGAKCNNVDLVEERLSCNMCSGDGCKMPESQLCPTYRENDKCYIEYDEQRSIVAMGCRSEFSNTEADYLFRLKRLYLCTDDNCNDVDKLPKAQDCTICNSRTDIACATNPDVLNTNVSCNMLPFPECYSRVLPDGATERGCVSNLYDDDFLNCLSDDESTCKVCSDDGCNVEVFPAGRASCHICDSSFDPQCESFPNNINICPKYDPAETCVTVFLDGVTSRGCSSSLSCDGAGSRGCSKCTGTGCNTIDLAKRQDDNFGKWQDLPLRCHVCSGDDCDELSAANVATCENNNEQDCVVVFGANGKVIQRGCADDVEETQRAYCAEHPDHCFNCKSNECNAAVALDEFVDCVYCDSHNSLDCLWQPQNESHRTRKCRGGCMTALYPTDSSTQPAYDLIRTCLDDKEAADQTRCSNGRDGNCKACTDASCNTDDLPEDRMSCLYCVNGECEESKSMKCPLYKKSDQCYIWFDDTNSVSEMGCVSSFRNQELETIIKTKRVYVCDEGDNCNALSAISGSQKCAACDSKQDVLCAINAKSVSTYDVCNKLPYTGCYSKLKSDGSTSRGCLTDLADNDFADCILGRDGNCESCNDDACNREVFPADRQQCFTCTSEDDADCESFPTRMQPCPIVNAAESCKSALSANETIRGCSSEIYCDGNDFRSCRSCFGTACNSIDVRNRVDDGYHGAFQELPLKCHECIGDHCKASLGPLKTCTRNVEQDCMTVFEADGSGVRRRGCADDVEDYEDLYCRQHPELCFKCKSNECNIAWSLDEYVDCVFCNSTQNAACAIAPQSSSFANRNCYKECMVTMNANGEVIRSCIDDKEIFPQNDCRSEGPNGKQCASCDSGHCNNFVYPSDRLKCHICSGNDCNTSVGQYCLKYDENDFCFAKYENGKVDLMGCGSSQSQKDLDEWTALKKLYRCDGDDCNDLTKLPTTGGECLSCDSSKTPACAQNPLQVTNSITCNAPNSDCVTHINSAGDTIRGCFNSLSESEQKSCIGAGTCAVCSDEKCNREIYPAGRRRCHICNSVSDTSCANSPNAVLICPIYATNDRCVAKHENNFISRGCATEITCDANDEKHCQICETDGCNTAKLGNGAFVATSSLLLTTILAFIAVRGLGGY